MEDLKDFLIMCGNPGTGKSTILNCLVGQPIFQSGISPGHGLTTELQLVQVGTTTYGDTPGLDDDTHREKAAAAITRALKQNGVYKLLFVVKLDAGRVRAADAATMRLVLDAVPKHVPYGILVNQVGAAVYRHVQEGTQGFRESILAQLMVGHRTTSSVYFMPRNRAWEEADNVVSELPASFTQFVAQLPAMIIAPSAVADVKANLVDAECEALNAELQQAYERGKDAEARVAQMEELSKRQQAELDESKAAIECAQRDLQALRRKNSRRGFGISIGFGPISVSF